jgi:hypothetical protein
VIPVVRPTRAIQERPECVGHIRSSGVAPTAREPEEKGKEREKRGEKEESYDAHVECLA